MATPSVYQRVGNATVTASDYDSSVGKVYLKFNGTNQWLQTNSIDFSYGDKMFVCAGVRKLSNAARGMFCEIGANWTSAGAFGLEYADPSGTANYVFGSTGSLFSSTIAANYTAPITNVISAIGNISGDQVILRVNGTQAAINISDQGTGNYGNYPLYIGARAGSSLWFNGRLYGMVIAGKSTSTSEITNTENYLNQKTGAY